MAPKCDLKISHRIVFEKGMELHMSVSRQSAFFNYLSYLIGRIQRTFHRIVRSEAYYGLPTTAHPSIPSWPVSKASSLSQHPTEQGFNT